MTNQLTKFSAIYSTFYVLAEWKASARDIAKFRAAVIRLLPTLSGFVRFEGDPNDKTCGIMAIWANKTYAGASIYDVQTQIGDHRLANITADEWFSPDAALAFDAASVAFRHTPSASNFERLTIAMFDYQRAKYPNDVI